MSPLLSTFLDFLRQREFLGANLLQWSEASIAAVITFAILVGIRWVLLSRLGKLAARTASIVDDLIVELVRRTRYGFLAVLALWPAGGFVQLSGGPARALRLLIVGITTFQAATWIGIAVTRGIEARRRALDPAAATTLGALSFLIRLVLYALLLLLALSNLGVNVTALVAGLGIGGVAVALALQNILGDLFASLSIVLDKPFVVGDFVVVGDLMGTVERIGLKTTRVRSLSGEQLIFGNRDLLQSRIRNFKRMHERRVQFQLGVVYETPTEKLRSLPGLLRSLVVAQPGVRFDRAHFKSFDDFALTFEIVYFVLDPDHNRYMDIHQGLLFAIAERFEKEGIAFAYPTRTLYVHSAAAAAPAAPAAAV
ncbi:MAG: mechanosensitive ion channel family protein [Gemmatimonadales bacterium]